MPFVTLKNTRLFYRLEGEERSPVILLSHSIGTDHAMWDPQASHLLSHFRVLRLDTRGHGASCSQPGDYSVEQLAEDVLGVADALQIEKFAFCGLSLGGAIGQWLAANKPERLTGLALANTSPRFGPAEDWDRRIHAVRQGGMAAIVNLAIERFFSPEFLARGNAHVASIQSVLLGTDPVGYVGCCAALRDFDSTEMLNRIKTPTLVLVGDRDISTPWSGHSDILARQIAGACAVHLPAAHLSNLECPRTFTAALLAFFDPDQSSPKDTLETGFKIRRQVLGDAHVDHSLAGTTEFTEDFQRLITRFAWGTIWGRPGLEERTRRLLVLGTMAALGRWEEFRLHISSGLSAGLEPCDIKEVLLQTAIYAGVPVANTAFQIAREEMERQKLRKTSSGQRTE